jgi:hypothetical protein
VIVDKLISNYELRVFVLRNSTRLLLWLAIKARGRESNRFGLGAKVRITAGGVTQYREINPYGSYLSTSDMRLYIGLGKQTVVQRLEIEWPRGKKQVLENVPADQFLTLDEANVGQALPPGASACQLINKSQTTKAHRPSPQSNTACRPTYKSAAHS